MNSKEYTADEVQEQFLNHIRMLVDYWGEESSNHTQTERLSGLAFSILSAIDGCSASLPGFVLAPLPHEDDKQYNINNGENYYPQNHQVDINCDIAGDLHSHFRL